MRKNIVAGNWKMNKTLQEGIALAKEPVSYTHLLPKSRNRLLLFVRLLWYWVSWDC